MGGKHRMVLGRYQDAKLGAERVLVGVSSSRERERGRGSWSSSSRERESGSWSGSWRERGEVKKLVNAFVARVRRRFGDKYAKVALAYIHDRHWSKTGIPKPTFYYALKKIEKSFDADKHWAILRSARRRKSRGLD